MIDFSLTEEQLAIQKTARDFAEQELKPSANEIDRIADPTQSWDWDLYTKANSLGFNKILIPEKYGGLGMTTLDACLVIEELSWADAGFGTSYFVTNAVSRHIDDACTDEQKEEFLAACCNDPEDRYFMAIAETERGVSKDLGADQSVQGIPASGQVAIDEFFVHTPIPMAFQKEYTTMAKQDGDDWILNGTKCFITFGTRAKLYTITAKCDPGDPDLAVATFFVPAGTPGLSFGHVEDKMGHRSTENAEVILDNVRVPDRWKHDWRVSISKRGQTLNVLMAAVAVGVARRAYEEALAYSQTRYKLGSVLVHKQAVQRMLVDMANMVRTSRLLLWQAAWYDELGAGYDVLANMAKVYTSEACIEVSRLAMQVFGGYGYMRDFPMEKIYRDARLMSIYDGANEIIRHTTIMPMLTAKGTI